MDNSGNGQAVVVLPSDTINWNQNWQPPLWNSASPILGFSGPNYTMNQEQQLPGQQEQAAVLVQPSDTITNTFSKIDPVTGEAITLKVTWQPTPDSPSPLLGSSGPNYIMDLDTGHQQLEQEHSLAETDVSNTLDPSVRPYTRVAETQELSGYYGPVAGPPLAVEVVLHIPILNIS